MKRVRESVESTHMFEEAAERVGRGARAAAA